MYTNISNTVGCGKEGGFGGGGGRRTKWRQNVGRESVEHYTKLNSGTLSHVMHHSIPPKKVIIYSIVSIFHINFL